MLGLIAAAVSAFYLAAIPIHIAVRLRIGADNHFGLGVSLFHSASAVQQSMKPFKPPKKRKSMKKPHPVDALASAKSALSHIRFDRLSLDGVLGTDDAAVTALICGGASALGCALLRTADGHLHLNLRPDFSSAHLRIELTGMITLRAGHIITAALSGAYQYGSRRFKAWTSIPSRAL